MEVIYVFGGIDTQDVLIRENPMGVRKEVENMVKSLGEGGGYILGAVHNIQPDVPPENIENMYVHAKKYSQKYYS